MEKASLYDTFPKSIMSHFKFQNGRHCQDRKKQNVYQIQNILFGYRSSFLFIALKMLQVILKAMLP